MIRSCRHGAVLACIRLRTVARSQQMTSISSMGRVMARSRPSDKIHRVQSRKRAGGSMPCQKHSVSFLVSYHSRRCKSGAHTICALVSRKRARPIGDASCCFPLRLRSCDAPSICAFQERTDCLPSHARFCSHFVSNMTEFNAKRRADRPHRKKVYSQLQEI